MRIILIAAVSADGYISKGTGVPWALPEDREHFRRLTEGQWLLLGRRTFDEMTGWFREHHPLVLTRRPLPVPWNEAAVSGVNEAVRRVEASGGEALWVCGGSSAYAAALPVADEVILTIVDDELGGGVKFPGMRPQDWEIVQQVRRKAGDAPAFQWVWYRRCAKGTGNDAAMV